MSMCMLYVYVCLLYVLLVHDGRSLLYVSGCVLYLYVCLLYVLLVHVTALSPRKLEQLYCYIVVSCFIL